jgi:hemerythrin-like domain-containing protein
MCSYCGCQELTAIAELTEEHDAVVTLSGRARRAVAAGDLDAAAGVVRLIAAVMTPHTAVEEDALFPAMAIDFGEHVLGLLSEHRVIEAVLAESADRTPIDSTWPARLLRMLDLLREHIIKEEDGVFPAALTTLEPAQWDLLAAVRDRVGSGLSAAAPVGPRS